MQKQSTTTIHNPSSFDHSIRKTHSKQQLYYPSFEDVYFQQPLKKVKSSSCITPLYLNYSLTTNIQSLPSNTHLPSYSKDSKSHIDTNPCTNNNKLHIDTNPCNIDTNHVIIDAHHSQIMDMSSEPTLETLYSRIRYNKKLKRLVLNFEGLHVSKPEHVKNVRDSIAGVIKSHHPYEDVKVQCIVNYDNYVVDDELLDEYTEFVVVYLEDNFYESVERFTTNNFLQEQLRKLEAAFARKSSIKSPKVNLGKRIIGSRYVVQEILGVGTYGKVSLAEDRETGNVVAVKELNKNKVESIGIMDWVRREIDIMKTLGKHPRICSLYDCIETEEYIHLIMEFVEKGAVESPYDEHVQFSEEVCHKYFVQMVEALDYIHNVHHICHRDFQLSNICLDKDNNIKVCDWGCADFFTMRHKSHQLFVGNSNYCSPEMLMKKPYYGPEIDIYMLGVCLYKMCTGFLPYRNAQCKLMGTMSIPLEEEEELSDECKDIIQRLLDPNPETRITIEQIKEHDWFKRSNPLLPNKH
ncbi:hypothetical protein ABK040_009834 [Willaertia magna]